ncbi:unnamed protein product [Cuscuta campestris]|uniref:DUF223 domain-containing protein n=1 Tax=Cuscuta campestris TaxID=132261 RepID=A0A484MQK1_9ASTE|nr:unnamed protein product [Cuscuta campestris]
MDVCGFWVTRVLRVTSPCMSTLLGKKMDDHISIQRLTRESNNCAIKARVSRLWDAYNLKNKKDIISTDMVLIDVEVLL